MTTELEFHPLANLFPLIEGEAFDKLVEDIKANGLHEPITLYDDKILDGRNRYRACQVAGWAPHLFKEYSSVDPSFDPIAYVISKNLHRRHLTTEQRAAIGAQIATMKQGARTDLPSKDGKSHGMSTEQAAKALNVSTSSIERAKKRVREDPEAHEQAKAGTLSKKAKSKPSRSELDRVVDLGPRRAEAFAERHPEASERRDPLSVEIQELREEIRSKRALPNISDVAAKLRTDAGKLFDEHSDSQERWQKWEAIIAHREHLVAQEIEDCVRDLRLLAGRITRLADRLEDKVPLRVVNGTEGGTLKEEPAGPGVPVIKAENVSGGEERLLREWEQDAA